MRRNSFAALAAALAFVVVAGSVPVYATPYASGVSVSGGTSVSFILNEPTDTLQYIINGGAPVALDGSTIGAKSFNLGSPTDTFSIVADNTETSGYTIPKVGTNVLGSTTHFPIDTQAANITIGGAGQITDDANGLMRYNYPHGVAISNNPNAANFGTAYITNSADQTDAPLPGRTSLLNKGIYAVRADGSDAYGYGDVAQQQVFAASSTNSPHRVFVGEDGSPYIAGLADAQSGVFRLSQDMTTLTLMLNGITGSNTIDINTANHGSVFKAVVTGSPATGNLKVYTIDEDLSSLEVNPAGGGLPDNTNRLWKYDMGSYDPGTSGPYAGLPVSVTPEAVRGPLLDGNCCEAGGSTESGIFLAYIDMDLGKDGKFYLSQNRSTGSLAGLFVVKPDGTNAWDSLTATRELPGQTPTSLDIFQNTNAIAVSPDQKWLAAIHGDNFITVVPLVDGIPDLANRLAIDTGSATIAARDLNFDAADNLWYVSQGQMLLRAFSPGGHTTTTLAWDGTEYTFDLATGSATIAGDFNGDGKVDALDYVVLRKQNPDITSGAGLMNYNAWRANFGTGASGAGSSLGGGSVPEPGTLVLVLTGLVALGFGRRRH